MQRRGVLLGGLCSALAWLAWRPPAHADAGLRACLADVLPPALDPLAIGWAVLATQGPDCDAAACLRHAGRPAAIPPVWGWVAAQVRDDFAAGRIMQVAGWQLSRTEAWLCAVLVRGS